MNTMAPPRPTEQHACRVRPTEQHACRVRLTAGPAAAAEARRQVRAAVGAWHVPVDPDVAVLLTSDLVTNAIRHETGEAIVLAVRCARGQLRVDVCGTSRAEPGQADAGTGPGLVLVATLSDEWGSYRTSAGKAVYFILAAGHGGQAPR